MLELIYTVFSVLFIGVFLVVAVFMLVTMLRALRAPTAYYPPAPSAREMVGQLTCPKCGSKDLGPIGYYTLRCKSCGFVFRIGTEHVGGFYVVPPIFWPFFRPEWR
jgi:hypothetical protein